MEVIPLLNAKNEWVEIEIKNISLFRLPPPKVRYLGRNLTEYA